MEVKQIYEYLNDVQKELLGESAVAIEDLQGIIQLGEAVANANAYDNYVKALVNRIGKTVFVARVYQGNAPSVLMDKWEFGSVLQKIDGDMPDAVENESWELEDGASYDPNVFHKPNVRAKFFNGKVTWEVDLSITDIQVKESFLSLEAMNSFLSMIYTKVENRLTMSADALIMRTINAGIGETVHADYGSTALASDSKVKAINLLYLYNQENGTSLTTTTCLKEPDFWRFAAYKIMLTASHLKTMSKVFNVGGTEKFTPRDVLKIVLLDECNARTKAYLQSDTFHEELVKLPEADEVAFWQGSGTNFDFASCSKVHVTTPSGDNVEVGGVLGVMFDRDTLGVSLYDSRVTSNYNAKAEFNNLFYKREGRYFLDLDENFVVFFIA